ncbi:MAG: PEP-CTERM sorting domain-containing protein [Bryobacteraceae bacterium]|nr:PEP-CTERM sorting domain-containing protein [Bryobacteraceae bacterium]
MKFARIGFLVLLASSLWAAPVVSITATSFANRVADRNTALGGQPFIILEDFEGGPTGGVGISFATGVGTFSASGNGTGGACIKPGGANGTTCDEMHVLNSSTTPFSGRYDTTFGPGGHWLDSNDMTSLSLNLTASFLNLPGGLGNLFFFITDIEDVGGQLTITANDGSTTTANFAGAANYSLPNGTLYFVNISSASGIKSISFANTSSGDGYGLDDFGTMALDDVGVPEPGTYGLVGLALAGLGLLRRRR